MPTKPNRAGQQQNYVPQGNGDASGEYADEATGSNIHFTNFKKPDEPTKEENVKQELTKAEAPKEDKSKYLGGSKVKSEFSATVQSKGFSKYGEEAVETFKEIVANANEDCIGILNFAMNNYNLSFINNQDASCSYFKPLTREINIKIDTLERGYENKGETIFHEIGHWLNDSFKTSESEKWYSRENMLTETHKYFEDRKSVAETLQEELNEFAANKYAPKIRAERRKFLNEKFKPFGFTFEEYTKNRDKSLEILRTDPEWNRIRDDVKARYFDGEFPTAAAANKHLNDLLVKWKLTGPHWAFFGIFEEQRKLYTQFQSEWGKATGMKGVSDAWSSRSDYGFGFGHDRAYYNKSSQNPEPEKRIADEFWANFFGALTTNNHVSLETTKKYFPRTTEKMLKLVDILKERKEKNDMMLETIRKFQEGGTV